MTNNINAARIAGHIDAAWTALQTAHDDLALAAVLAEQGSVILDTSAAARVLALRNLAGAVMVAENGVADESQKWVADLTASEEGADASR